MTLLHMPHLLPHAANTVWMRGSMSPQSITKLLLKHICICINRVYKRKHLRQSASQKMSHKSVPKKCSKKCHKSVMKRVKKFPKSVSKRSPTKMKKCQKEVENGVAICIPNAVGNSGFPEVNGFAKVVSHPSPVQKPKWVSPSYPRLTISLKMASS